MVCLHNSFSCFFNSCTATITFSISVDGIVLRNSFSSVFSVLLWNNCRYSEWKATLDDKRKKSTIMQLCNFSDGLSGNVPSARLWRELMSFNYTRKIIVKVSDILPQDICCGLMKLLFNKTKKKVVKAPTATRNDTYSRKQRKYVRKQSNSSPRKLSWHLNAVTFSFSTTNHPQALNYLKEKYSHTFPKLRLELFFLNLFLWTKIIPFFSDLEL